MSLWMDERRIPRPHCDLLKTPGSSWVSSFYGHAVSSRNPVLLLNQEFRFRELNCGATSRAFDMVALLLFYTVLYQETVYKKEQELVNTCSKEMHNVTDQHPSMFCNNLNLPARPRFDLFLQSTVSSV